MLTTLNDQAILKPFAHIRLDHKKDALLAAQQLAAQIITFMDKGHLRSGDPLPAMRTLSQQLSINYGIVQFSYTIVRNQEYIDYSKEYGAFLVRKSLPKPQENILEAIQHAASETRKALKDYRDPERWEDPKRWLISDETVPLPENDEDFTETSEKSAKPPEDIPERLEHDPFKWIML